MDLKQAIKLKGMLWQEATGDKNDLGSNRK
jgi:hypothetical protein